MKTRTPERIEFLHSVLVCAIEHGGYGFPSAIEYQPFPEAEAFALIIDRYEEEDNPGVEPKTYRVDLDLIAKGIGVIKDAKPQVDPNHPGDGEVLFTAQGKRLYLSQDGRKLILECSRTNDAGEIDVVLALAVLECAVFGRVMYN